MREAPTKWHLEAERLVILRLVPAADARLHAAAFSRQQQQSDLRAARPPTLLAGDVTRTVHTHRHARVRSVIREGHLEAAALRDDGRLGTVMEVTDVKQVVLGRKQPGYTD